jgi:hypothetical protein
MNPLPSSEMRHNLATWAVPDGHLPAVAHVLHDVLPNEVYDPHFQGQHLTTTYFDTQGFALRKARLHADRYLTLRVRCYQAPDGSEVYALSAKTEQEKWRSEIEPNLAEMLIAGIEELDSLLPAHLLARLQELTDKDPLVPVVAVRCRRYAVEDEQDRFTLDVDVTTDTGKGLACNVLEFKSIAPGALPPARLDLLGLRPLKLSKFLWATDWR